MSRTKPVCLIVAKSENNGIGKNNTLPWRLKNEMNHFTKMTQSTRDNDKINAVIMGRKTWESIPPKYKPLSGRFNVIISKEVNKFHPETKSYTSLSSCLQDLQNSNSFSDIESIWIVGGSGIYKEAIETAVCDKLYVTNIMKYVECDTFFPDIPADKYVETTDENLPSGLQKENDIAYEFKVYEKV